MFVFFFSGVLRLRQQVLGASALLRLKSRRGLQCFQFCTAGNDLREHHTKSNALESVPPVLCFLFLQQIVLVKLLLELLEFMMRGLGIDQDPGHLGPVFSGATALRPS